MLDHVLHNAFECPRFVVDGRIDRTARAEEVAVEIHQEGDGYRSPNPIPIARMDKNISAELSAACVAPAEVYHADAFVKIDTVLPRHSLLGHALATRRTIPNLLAKSRPALGAKVDVRLAFAGDFEVKIRAVRQLPLARRVGTAAPNDILYSEVSDLRFRRGVFVGAEEGVREQLGWV